MQRTKSDSLNVSKLAVGLAAGIGGLAASQARAGVVYTPFTATVDASNPQVNLDFDHDGETDVSIDYSSSSGITLDKAGQKMSYVADSSNNNVAPLAFSETIDATPPAGDQYNELKYTGTTTAQLNGDFTSTSGMAYIGLDLGLSSDSNDDYYGWIGFQITNDSSLADMSGQIDGFAYEAVPDAGITAGAVPEPTSLALLAMGCTGLAFYRRRGARHNRSSPLP